MEKKLLYMTYDDAPVADFREKVDYLDSKGIKAIWYCQGNRLEEFMDLAVYAIKQGHVIGNHSYDHPFFSKLSLAEAKSQIDRTEKLIEEAYRLAEIKRPYKTFRFPYLDVGEGTTGDPVDFSHSHTVALQQLLIDTGFIVPKFEGITYGWYSDMGYDRTASMECTYDSFDWVMEQEIPFLGYHSLDSILKRMDEDEPTSGRGLGHNISNEIVMNHAYIALEAFKAIVDKLAMINGEFALPKSCGKQN